MRNDRVVACIVITAVLAVACETDDGVLARVGDSPIRIEAFQEYLVAATGEPWEGLSEPVASRIFDQFLDQEIVVAAAAGEGRPSIPTEPGARSARVRYLLDELCGPPPPPDSAVVEAQVAAALEEIRPARARVRQMLLDTFDAAQEARRRLDEGADFVELSKAVSRAPNADAGGELGVLTQGGLSENLDEVIFALAEGEISEPVPGPSGYHIFQVLEAIPAGPPSREEIEPEVLRRLSEKAARDHAAACVRRLAEKIGVEVEYERLWFQYQGRYAEVIHAR